MPRIVLQTYAAAVCFASVACFAIAVGNIAYSTVTILNPAFTLNPMSIPPYESPPFMIPQAAMSGSQMGNETVTIAPLSEEDVSKRRAAALDVAMQNELATARQSLIRWGIAAVISGLLFLGHWRILRRENRT